MTPQQSRPAINIHSDDIDIGKLFGILLDSKWLIIAITFMFSLFGVASALLSTPIYNANALIQIEQKALGE